MSPRPPDPRILARALRARIMADLEATARPDGTVSVKEVHKAARRARVSERSIYDWRKNGLPSFERTGFVWEPDYDLLLAECRGKVAEFRRRLAERGVDPLPTRQRLNTIVQQRFHARGREHLRKGEYGSRPYKLRRIIEVGARNEQWQTDFFNLGLPVKHPDFPSQIVDLWACAFLDSLTRVIVGAAVGIDKDAGLSLSALAAALRSDGVYGPWGGKPDEILTDRDNALLADALVEDYVVVLDLKVEQCWVGSPEGKGKVERWGQTIKNRWARLQPDSTDGPKRNNGELYPATKEPDYHARAAGLFQAIDEYNNVWPHSSIGDIPPAQKWHAESNELRVFQQQELLELMKSEQARVGQKGVARFNDHYWAPELHNLVGEPVEVRYVHGDTRQVEVLRDGRWLCSAVPNRDRSDEDDDRYSQLERAEVLRLNNLVRGANRAPKPRTRIAITQAGDASPLRDPSPAAPFRIASNADIVNLLPQPPADRRRAS